MSGKRKRLYYKLIPVFAPEPGSPPQIVSAAVVECMATGRLLAGGGGGGLALATDIVDALNAARHDGRARVVVDEAIYLKTRVALQQALQTVLTLTSEWSPDAMEECHEHLRAVISALGDPKTSH